MRRALAAASALIVVAAAPDAAAAAKRRMIVFGGEDDPLTARVHKELVAMGFEVTRGGAAAGCSRSAVAGQVEQAHAHGATCTDGDATGIWIMEPGGMRLRDVVVARATDEQQRDMAAVRAAEIARASVELVDADGSSKPKPKSPSGRATADGTAADKDRGAAAPDDKNASRVPAFVAGLGMSSLLGVDASVGALSAEVEIGVGRWLAIAPRLDYPIESQNLNPSFSGGFGSSDGLRAQPGFTGVSAVIPLSRSSAFVIPRVGAGVGAAWIRATSDATSSSRFLPDGSFQEFPTSTGGSDTTWSPALYATGALSMRIGGPFRVTVDGAFGTTVSRLVVRTQQVDRAYWGAPFGALAIRMELLFR